MTAPPRPGKLPVPAEPPRRNYEARPVGALLPGITRAAFRSQGPALALVLADWPAIVGPALAAVTLPRRLSAGTLTLGCAGPVALELQHLAGPLMERVNTQLGRAAVQRLRFVQEVVSSPSPAPRPRPVRPLAPVEGLADGPLRDALGALGAAISAAAEEAGQGTGAKRRA